MTENCKKKNITEQISDLQHWIRIVGSTTLVLAGAATLLALMGQFPWATKIELGEQKKELKEIKKTVDEINIRQIKIEVMLQQQLEKEQESNGQKNN